MQYHFNDSLRIWHSLSEYGAWLHDRRPLLSPAMIRDLSAGALQPQTDGGYHLKCDPALGRAKTREKNTALLWTMLASISSPVLVLRGIGSAVLTTDIAAKMEKVLPNGRLRMISRAGHGVVVDNPREFTDALHSFLSELRGSTTRF